MQVSMSLEMIFAMLKTDCLDPTMQRRGMMRRTLHGCGLRCVYEKAVQKRD